MADKIRVGVVDIYPIFRDGVVQAMRRSGNFVVVAVGMSAADAERIAPLCDVLLLESAVPGSLDAVRHVLRVAPSTKIVFLSADQDDEHASQALHLGVHGYLMKEITGSDLARSVEAVHLGAPQIASDLAWRLLSKVRGVAPVTIAPKRQLGVRERQVLDHTSKGLTNAQMANLLGLSISSVKRYKTRMFRLMGVRNRLQAIIATVDGRKPKAM